MPVADHPVHESTKRSDQQPACYNCRQPSRHGFQAKNGWDMRTNAPLWTWVPHRMTKECQSDFPPCAGCKDFIQKEQKGQ